MSRKKQKRNALIVILIGSILAALICSECLILNTTASVPRGLWLKLDCLPKIGDFVQVPIDAFSSTDWVPHEYFRKNIWRKNKPFLKRSLVFKAISLNRATTALSSSTAFLFLTVRLFLMTERGDS